jgi:hypothetical protein
MTTMTTGHPTWATALPLAVAEGPLHTDGCLRGDGYTTSAREQRLLRRRAMQALECLLRGTPLKVTPATHPHADHRAGA